MSSALWLENLAALRAVGRPVLVELLGHARSPAPEDEAAYRVERYAEWFEEIRKKLGLARWVVCGHSLGAGVVLNYALRHPEAVSAAIVTNSLSAFDAIGVAEAQKRVAAMQETLRAGGAKAIRRIPYHPRMMRGVSDRVREALIDDAEAHDARGVEKTMRVTASGAGVSTRLGALRPPTLLVNGLREKGFQEARRRAAKAAPTLEIVDVDGGHSINAEQPAAFNAAVHNFLQRHLPQEAS